MSDSTFKKLSDALWYAYHEDPSTEGHLAQVRDRKPILKRLTDEQIRDFVEGIHDNLVELIDACAREYANDLDKARVCRCLNPRCNVDSLEESALHEHYPDPKLLDTLSPGDTIPLGLCPECKGPIYQPEEFPEDEVDACCDCFDCRQGRARPLHTDQAQSPVDGCTCRFCVAKRCALEGISQDVTEALLQGEGDNTGIPTADSTAAVGVEYEPRAYGGLKPKI